MASSTVMASTSPTNPELPRQSSPSIHSHSTLNFSSVNMDELANFPFTVNGGENAESDMTLEDFLTKTGAVKEEEAVKLSEVMSAPGYVVDSMIAGTVKEEDVVKLSAVMPAPGYVVDSMIGGPPQFQVTGGCMQSVGSSGLEGFGNGIVDVGALATGGGSGRGKRRTVEEPPIDKATQQKQKRMIKNRESAARSRERKQAHNVELEQLVAQLEEENSRLMREEEEMTRERYKQFSGFDKELQSNFWVIHFTDDDSKSHCGERCSYQKT